MNVKKIILAFALAVAVILPLTAESETPGGHVKADISYVMAPVYKVMDSSDAYVVIYGKPGNKMGTVTVPKAWAKYNKDVEVRKLVIRALPRKLNPYITVVNKNGDFLKVILTIPTDHNNAIWGRANNKNVDAEGIESISLEI